MQTNCSENIPGVCLDYEFCMPKHTSSIFVRGAIYLPVTPATRCILPSVKSD